MSNEITSPLDPEHPDNVRIREGATRAADAAYWARVEKAVAHASAQPDAGTPRGISYGLMAELHGPQRHKLSPEGFRAFARDLGVSARWLAIGAGEMTPVDPEPRRIDQVGERASRISAAMRKRVERDGTPLDMAKIRTIADIDLARWPQLFLGEGPEPTVRELAGCARALGVPQTWLATGDGSMDSFIAFQEPPIGWFAFGHHVDAGEIPLEFSIEHDATGMPMWERVSRNTALEVQR